MSLEKINKAAYEVFSSMDEDEAKLVLSAIVYDTLPPYIEEQTPIIQQHVDAWIAKRFDAYERFLKRQYIERVQKNEDTADLEAAYETISKATFDNRTYDWTPERERLHPRDARGRFRDSPYKITKPTGPMKPIKNPERVGIPDFANEGAKNIRPERVAELQNAYLQVVNTLKAHEQMGLGDQKFSIRGTNGTQVYEGLNEDNVKAVFRQYAKTGNKPIEFKVITPQTTVGGVYFDALSSIPTYRKLSPEELNNLSSDERDAYDAMVSRRSGHVTNTAMGMYVGGRDLPDNIGTGSPFQQGWFNNSYALSENEPRFRRLKAGAELVDTFVPQSAIKTKAALAGAKYVGELGPDAEKIIGPTARKITYRSRGTEKKSISPEIRNVDATDRTRAILGYGQPTMRRDGKVTLSGEPGTIPGFFVSRLPNKDYWELQRKSGAVPPSEGVVIDASGKVVSQSVGFKDDHYLPFSLKALAKLRGGEYVRTRSTGGPTTEDIYTALIGGATGFTVVSRSGIFTVDFDPSFVGRRRYNDKAGKMVERYGKLLDAAGSGEVTLKDVDPERNAEIVEQAREGTTNREDYKAYLNKLLDEEKFKPKASQAMREDVFARAQTKVMEETINGTGQFAARYNQLKANGTPPEMLRSIVNREAEDRTNAMLREELKKRSFKAMKLDGDGYYASLQALKEQYPYYIKEIHYHPLNAGERDKGYVKPKFLRPDEVWEGYFDPNIKGNSQAVGGRMLNEHMVIDSHQAGKHGKVKASGTNYQNFKVSDPREEAVQEAETKATEGSAATTPSERKAKFVELDAHERKVAQLARAYAAMNDTEVEQDGGKVKAISDKLADFEIDPLDIMGDIRRKDREDPTFLKNLHSELASHLRTVGNHVGAAGRNNPQLMEWRSAMKAYEQEVTPRLSIPQGANPGKLAMGNPDKVLDFPDLANAGDAELQESLRNPVVADALELLEDKTPEGITDRLKVLGEAYLKEERNKPESIAGSTPSMEAMERQAMGLARAKAILVRREQLGGSEAYQADLIGDNGDIMTRLIGSGS